MQRLRRCSVNMTVKKYVLTIAIANEVRVKLIAYQSSKRAVSNYRKRYLTANVEDEYKIQLATRFSEVTDPNMRQEKEKLNETMQVFA